ncbi:MAG: hypothetical protein M3119_00880 [Verrucomicrobiota bacterium]|nr:hypothetical protein [Verrucomicrobiota bacterium]
MLRDDIESVETLLKLLNDEDLGCRAVVNKEVEGADVVRGLEKLIQKEWVQVLIYDPKQKELVPSDTPPATGWFSDETWFRLTNLGRSSIEESASDSKTVGG